MSQVSVGHNHTIAIKKDGTLWAWGTNQYGQLGDGTRFGRVSPVLITKNVKKASAGYEYTIALKTDGTLWAWGRNNNGQLGDGTTTDRLSPVQIMENATGVTTGSLHSTAIRNDGTLWTWGNNSYGQIGDGTTNNRFTPVKIMDGIKKVYTMYQRNYALKNDNTLWAWGYNESGVLGDGSTTNRVTPVKTLDNVKQLSTGPFHTMAIKDDGTLWGWGYGGSRIGDGTSEKERPTPVKVLNDAMDVSAGSFSTLAVQKDGTLWAWGGSLIGDGTKKSRNAPCSIVESASFCHITECVLPLNTLQLVIGEEYVLLPEISPKNGCYHSITYSSDDTQIAIPSSRGIITAKKVGKTTITVTVDEKFTATCTITVVDDYEIRVNSSTHGTVTSSVSKAKQGETVTLTVKPDNGYMLESLDILDANGAPVEYQRNGETVTFVMPASAVTVSATFIDAALAVRTSAAGYATFYDSGWAVTLPSGLQAQVVAGISNGKLSYKTLTGSVVPKDVAVMLTADLKRAADYTLTRTESTATYSGTNLLKGSDEATTTTGDGYHYKLSYGPSSDSSLKDVFGWYWGAQDGGAFQIDGHKAWLVVPRSAGARSFSADGEANGISDIDVESADNSSYYDLQGRQVSQPTKKGLYIKNGKKIVNK